MKQVTLMLLSLAVFAAGCGDDILDITDPIGPIDFTPSNQVEQGNDECDFFDPGQPDGTFSVTIDGNVAELTHTFEIMTDTGTETISRTATTSIYEETDDTVILTTTRTNTEFPPCEVNITETYTVQLDDPDSSLDQNTTLSVTLEHQEAELSSDVCYPVPNDPMDESNIWFVPLPCSSQVTFTLTQQ